jgi:NAD(P)-dependent dehydrogenase (short-subunit alcohol dehydrogenase family)
MLLEGKVAIVTGGGRGIGRAIAKRFAAEGAKVVIAQRDGPSGERTRQEIEQAGGAVLFVETDIARREAVEHLVRETVQHFGRIDILVNNAAMMGGSGPFLEATQEAWDSMLATSLTGVFMCSQAAARVMARGGGGSILNVTSSTAFIPQPEACAYGAAKGGVEILTRSMATDLAPFNIRVNAIAPGPIQSRSPDDEPPRPTGATLLGRMGLPKEVAEVALFFASDESSFVTGQSLCVDGGLLVNAYSLYNAPRPKPQGGS